MGLSALANGSFHYLSYQFPMRIQSNYTEIKLKQERWGHVEISKEREAFEE